MIRSWMRVICFSLASVLALLVVRPVYASATPSNATPSNATMGDAVYLYDVMERSLSESVFSVARALPFYVDNTIDFSGASCQVWYYDMSNVIKVATGYCDSSGHFFIPRPVDFASFESFNFIFNTPSLPPSGTYEFSFSFSSDVGGFEYQSTGGLFLVKDLYNSTSRQAFGYFLVAQQSGSLSFPMTVLDIANLSYMNFHIGTVDNKMVWPFGGYISARFVPSSSSDPALSNTNPADTSADLSNISTGVSNISSGISSVASAIEDLPSASEIGAAVASAMEPHYNNILTQLHHITEQLHAFWDQLAAYFNDRLIPQMVTDTDRIVEAIENIDIQVNVSMQELKDTLNQNHQSQLANDNKIAADKESADQSRHEDNLYGFDQSGMDAENDKLSGALEEYETVEEELLADSKGYIENFEFKNIFETFIYPMQDISSILSMIYNNIGDFKVVVEFSFILTVALMLIGWYRFRGA